MLTSASQVLACNQALGSLKAVHDPSAQNLAYAQSSALARAMTSCKYGKDASHIIPSHPPSFCSSSSLHVDGNGRHDEDRQVEVIDPFTPAVRHSVSATELHASQVTIALDRGRSALRMNEAWLSAAAASLKAK